MLAAGKRVSQIIDKSCFAGAPEALVSALKFEFRGGAVFQ